MVAPLLAFLVIGHSPTTIDLVPTDDVWVYPHASDPSKDPFLRIWGSEGNAVAPSPDDAQNYSYSYLKWDVSKIPSDAKIKSASLVLTHVAGAAFTLDYAKKHPIEARPLGTTFTEKKWQYDNATTLFPPKDAKAIYGSGAPTAIGDDEATFKIEIDLLKGPKDFKKALQDAVATNEKQLGMALTSTTNPEEMGMKFVYKVYSKDAEKAEYRPTIHIELE